VFAARFVRTGMKAMALRRRAKDVTCAGMRLTIAQHKAEALAGPRAGTVSVEWANIFGVGENLATSAEIVFRFAYPGQL